MKPPVPVGNKMPAGAGREVGTTSRNLLRMRALLIGAAVLFVGASAAHGDCIGPDISAAEEAVDSLESWMSIYTAFARYGRCDDGGIAEGFTDAVVHLLASDWSSLPSAASIAQKHPAFRAFVLRHIDASADAGELESIGTLATSQCPAEMESLCKDILLAASASLASR